MDFYTIRKITQIGPELSKDFVDVRIVVPVHSPTRRLYFKLIFLMNFADKNLM